MDHILWSGEVDIWSSVPSLSVLSGNVVYSKNVEIRLRHVCRQHLLVSSKTMPKKKQDYVIYHNFALGR